MDLALADLEVDRARARGRPGTTCRCRASRGRAVGRSSSRRPHRRRGASASRCICVRGTGNAAEETAAFPIHDSARWAQESQKPLPSHSSTFAPSIVLVGRTHCFSTVSPASSFLADSQASLPALSYVNVTTILPSLMAWIASFWPSMPTTLNSLEAVGRLERGDHAEGHRVVVGVDDVDLARSVLLEEVVHGRQRVLALVVGDHAVDDLDLRVVGREPVDELVVAVGRRRRPRPCPGSR